MHNVKIPPITLAKIKVTTPGFILKPCDVACCLQSKIAILTTIKMINRTHTNVGVEIWFTHEGSLQF